VPVFVFDGKAGLEKKDTQDDRRAKREKIKLEFQALKAEVAEMDVFNVPSEKVARLDSLARQHTYLSNEEIEGFKDFLDAMGIPVVKAKGEAEPLCCSFNIEQVGCAVFSTDTDLIMYGCPLILNKFLSMDDTGMYPVYKAMNTETLRDAMGFNQRQMVDMGIMMGCDYNKRMKGIGPVKSFDLIKKHVSIDSLPDKFDTECLNVALCRDIFKYRPSKDLIESGRLDFDSEKVKNAKQIAASFGLSDLDRYLDNIVSKTPKVTIEYYYNPVNGKYITAPPMGPRKLTLAETIDTLDVNQLLNKLEIKDEEDTIPE
jgi:5'-3' exonuclease